MSRKPSQHRRDRNSTTGRGQGQERPPRTRGMQRGMNSAFGPHPMRRHNSCAPHSVWLLQLCGTASQVRTASPQTSTSSIVVRQIPPTRSHPAPQPRGQRSARLMVPTGQVTGSGVLGGGGLGGGVPAAGSLGVGSLATGGGGAESLAAPFRDCRRRFLRCLPCFLASISLRARPPRSRHPPHRVCIGDQWAPHAPRSG